MSRQHGTSSDFCIIIFQYHNTSNIPSSDNSTIRHDSKRRIQQHTRLVFGCGTRRLPCQLAINIHRPLQTSINVLCISRPKCTTRWAISFTVYAVFSWKVRVCVCVFMCVCGLRRLRFFFLVSHCPTGNDLWIDIDANHSRMITTHLFTCY